MSEYGGSVPLSLWEQHADSGSLTALITLRRNDPLTHLTTGAARALNPLSADLLA